MPDRLIHFHSEVIINRFIFAAFAGMICVYFLSLFVEKANAQVFPYTAGEKRKQNKDGSWTVTTKICNNTTADATIAFWSWPKEKTGAKIDSLEWWPAGTVGRPNPNQKLPAGTDAGGEIKAGKCQEVDNKRTKEPFSSYVRVFKKNATTGAWTQENTLAHNVHLAALSFPDADSLDRLISIPVGIPYPEDLIDLVGRVEADFSVASISSPTGWTFVESSPALRETFTLGPDDKNFTAEVILDTGLPNLAEGERVFVDVTWQATVPGFDILYERIDHTVVVNDNTPPSMTLEFEQDSASDSTVVRIRSRDVGGIHHLPLLTLLTTVNDQQILITTIPIDVQEIVASDVLPSIGTIELVYEETFHPQLSVGVTLFATHQDQFGNLGESNIVVIPEPSTVTLGILGILGSVCLHRRCRRRFGARC